MRNKLLNELRRTFRPEFINRIDSVIVFKPLTEEEIGEIVRLEVAKVSDRRRSSASVTITEAARKHLSSRATTATSAPGRSGG